MPEAEEFLIDTARHATVAVQEIWRRRRRADVDPTPQWHLEDCRLRLALLVEAVLGLQVPIRNAQAPAPPSWAARLLRRAPRAMLQALPATDGVAIYLPPRLEIVDDAPRTASNDYPLLALMQALRLARGSANCFPRCDSPLAADLFLLAEAAAADRAMRRLAPGWSAALDRLYARCVTAIVPAHGGGIRRAVLELYAGMLQHPAAHAVPAFADAQSALDWANGEARRLASSFPRERHVPCLHDLVTGRLLPPEAAPSVLARMAPGAAHDESPQRRATLSRRPRSRKSTQDEDDAQPGVWMVQTSEPQEHAEDPRGLNRPQDRDADADVEGMAQSLAELDTARLVSTPGRATEVMCSDDPPPRREVEETATALVGAFAYPEWDCRISAYGSQAVQVHVKHASEGSQAWVDETLRRHHGTLETLRRRLGIIRPQRQILKRQTDGDDIDCDALVDERSVRRAGGSCSGAVYLQHRRAPRRIGLLLLIDASASTDSAVADGRRVIDVEKEAALVAACALQMTGAEFAVFVFSGEGPHGVQMRAIKDFTEPWSAAAMRRIAALEPDRYTRVGGAVRHACALLAPRPVDHRLLLLFSDGKPNDCDCYAGAYGLEDARQALIEARAQRIDPYCFTVDREGSGYLPHLFGAGHYTVVQRAQQLPQAFLDWLRNAARRASR